MRALVDRFATEGLRQWLPLATLVILVVLVGTMQPVFLQPATLLQLASDTAVLFILATGVTFVIMLGGIDLSIQSMASLASVIVALTLADYGYGAFVLAIGVGVLAGLLSGLAHVRLKIPSFIATLAMGGVLYSSALVLSGERSITLADAERLYLTWITGNALGIPNVIVIGLAVLIFAHILQSRTRFGRYSAAIGAGEPAAYASGVKVSRQKVDAFVLSGGIAALAGELLLPSIAAVVVGGTAITGGVGSIWRTLVGALIISVVRIGMTFLGVNIFAQNIVFGLVLIAAVAITIDRSKIPIVK
jgi:ribose transport system permease protein